MGRHCIVALVVAKAEREVRIDGVEPVVLQRVRADLVREPDAAPFLAQVEQSRRASQASSLSAASSCSRQSQRSEPSTSPVRHSECSRVGTSRPHHVAVDHRQVLTCRPGCCSRRRRFESAEAAGQIGDGVDLTQILWTPKPEQSWFRRARRGSSGRDLCHAAAALEVLIEIGRWEVGRTTGAAVHASRRGQAVGKPPREADLRRRDSSQ